MKRAHTSHLALLFIVAIVFCRSGWRPHDRFTWSLEITPGGGGIIILLATYRRFQFTTLCYALIALYICVLCVGGHYTYARVPRVRLAPPDFRMAAQSITTGSAISCRDSCPAVIAREMFIGINIVNRKKWIPFLVVSVCLAISAFYELVEWWMALISGNAANDFIGSQGDVWDTQADMLFALIGAVCALLLLSCFHDRALRNIAERTR